MAKSDAPVPSLTRVRWWLLLFAVVQRVVFRFESTELPFMEAPLFDSGVYLRQAESITAGRFDDPTLVAFGPLYGWFLAVFGECGIDAQLVLGALTAFVVERIAARRSPAEGLVALALWIGYAVPLFYETKIMSEALGLFLIVVALGLYTSPRVDRAERASSIAAGAVLGLATLARANLLFAIPFFVLGALVARADETRRARLSRAAWVALGVVLVLGMNGAWNLATFGRFIPVILTSRTASRASADGTWTGSLAVFGTTDRPPSAWDVVEQAEATLASPSSSGVAPSIDFVGWARSSPEKLVRTFSDVETTFDYGFYGERSELPSLAWQPVSMGILLLLGLAGAIALARERGLRAIVPYLPLVLGVVLVTTLFHPSTRYRLSMAPPLALLSAHALVAIAGIEERRRRIGLGLATLAICGLLAFRHLTHPLASPAMWQVRVAEGEAARGDVDAARSRIARAMAYDDAAATERIRALREAHALPDARP